jgi:two-component sensor histidine kinase/CheY-like chemotaxis protein
VTTDITFRKEAEARQALLAMEVDHRAKNTLAVVQALVRLARRESIDDYVKALEGRIGALAQTHELLSKARWEGADLLHLILEELAPYNDGMQRVTAVGPALLLSPEDTQLLAMALHELATNAAKYGALSSVAGRVDVSWSHFEGRLTLSWRESGGPAVSVPGKTGFGTRIIQSSFKGARRGDAQFDWGDNGLRCTLLLDCHVKQPAAQRTKDIVQAGERALSELRVPATKVRLLLVEDEAIVGMFMEELLQGLGFETIGPVASLAESLAVAKRESFDAAILDMNLRGESVYPLADLLMARRIPFIFVTGYSKAGVESRFAGIHIVEKPATHEALQKALNGLFAHAAPANTQGSNQESRAAH